MPKDFAVGQATDDPHRLTTAGPINTRKKMNRKNSLSGQAFADGEDAMSVFDAPTSRRALWLKVCRLVLVVATLLIWAIVIGPNCFTALVNAVGQRSGPSLQTTLDWVSGALLVLGVFSYSMELRREHRQFKREVEWFAVMRHCAEHLRETKKGIRAVAVKTFFTTGGVLRAYMACIQAGQPFAAVMELGLEDEVFKSDISFSNDRDSVVGFLQQDFPSAASELLDMLGMGATAAEQDITAANPAQIG